MKNIDWSEIYGVGEIVCYCDKCGAQERFLFVDNSPNFMSAQQELYNKGWDSLKIEGKWRDFCCEKCRNDYIKKL